MVEKPEFLALINPVAGLPAAKQIELLAKFEPSVTVTIGKDCDHDGFIRLVWPPRVVLVAYAGLLAEQHGKLHDRTDSLVASKAAVHKRGSHVVEASGRDSRKKWPAMKRDGEDMCRRLSQGAKSALNAKRGARRLDDDWTDSDIRDMLRVKESRKYPNWRTRRAAIVKLGIKPVPGRTVFIEKLETIARARGLID